MGTLAAMAETSQLHRWKGSMGDAYLARNPSHAVNVERMASPAQPLVAGLCQRADDSATFPYAPAHSHIGAST